MTEQKVFPSCGRAEVDVIAVANEVMAALESRRIPLQVAVMGCVVNGPGEAKDADLGVAGGKGRGVERRRGEPVREALCGARDELLVTHGSLPGGRLRSSSGEDDI